MRIYVNTHPYEVPRGPISYRRIAEIAGDPFRRPLTVTYYWRGKNMQRSGVLGADWTIEPEDGMRFTAVYTGNA